ncbi:MAG: CCA tRNA nucleotidyltransferase, partial [Candidatus Geothermincolia bacterium]
MATREPAPIELPEAVRSLASRIAAAGGSVFVVGGWVRDWLRGAVCTDIDLATDLSPAKVKEALEGFGPIYDIGEKFGTVCAQSGEYTLEVTTLRTDEYSEGSRHPKVTHVEDIREDLARRDFTFNAMAVQVAPRTGGLIDPFGGEADLVSGLVRTPGPPAPRMAEDPLRMMRAVRFAAQLGFRIDEDLLRVIVEHAHQLDGISWERRRDELEKILGSPNPGSGVRLLVDSGLMDHVAPELGAMKGVEQPSAYHRADVLEHTLLTMGYLGPDLLLRRAALFHDVGKPPSRITDPKVMFPEHDKVGAELTRAAMRRLRYSTEEIQATVFLVRRHMRPIHYERGWSDAA